MVLERFFGAATKPEPTPTAPSPPPIESPDEKRYLNAAKDFKPTALEDYGYFFFPERFRQRTCAHNSTTHLTAVDTFRWCLTWPSEKDRMWKICLQINRVQSIDQNTRSSTCRSAVSDWTCHDISVVNTATMPCQRECSIQQRIKSSSVEINWRTSTIVSSLDWCKPSTTAETKSISKIYAILPAVKSGRWISPTVVS